MLICYLVMWSATVQPFIAGEYQDCDRCEAAGVVQKVGLRYLSTTPLHFRCELRS